MLCGGIYLPPDLQPLLKANGIERCIAVQAHHSLDEARWLLDLCDEYPFLAGTVVWVDLTDPRLAFVLDELQLRSGFKGIRHIIEDEAEDSWMLQAAVVRGFRELERRDIPYDLLVRPRHLSYVFQSRELCPELRLVIDHMAKPPIKTRSMDGWESGIARIATLPKVWCKLSGLITESDWENWKTGDFVPYVRRVAGCFGYDRLMFGSDWPVCTLAGPYGKAVSAMRESLGELSGQEEADVWGLTAIQFYGLT